MSVFEIDSIVYERWCRAAVFHGPGQPWEMAPIDLHTERDEAIVSVEACTLCSSDVHTVTGRRAGPVPSVLGHEAIGKVVSLPESWPLVDVDGAPVSVGDRIVWGVAAHCGDCVFCRDGIPQKCVRLVKYGHGVHRPDQLPRGGLAGFVGLVRGTPVVVLDDTIDARIACLAACAGATVAAALRLAGDVRGRHVAVFGGGVLGCIACAMARDYGAASVACVEPDASRRSRAIAFGADVAMDPAEPGFEDRLKCVNDGLGVDACLEITGANAAFEAGLKSLRTGGTLVLVGAVYPAGPVAISQEDIVRRMLTIRGLHNYAPVDLAAAVHFLHERSKKDPANLADLFGPEFPLDDVAEAFAWAADNPGVRAVVRP